MSKGAIWFFSHWLIMGRSKNWSDLRSPTGKIRDIKIVDSYDLKTSSESWKVRSSPVPLARRQRRKKVTWRRVLPSDLATWPWKAGGHHLQTSCKIDGWVAMQTFAALRAVVFHYSWKTSRGAGNSQTCARISSTLFCDSKSWLK